MKALSAAHLIRLSKSLRIAIVALTFICCSDANCIESSEILKTVSELLASGNAKQAQELLSTHEKQFENSAEFFYLRAKSAFLQWQRPDATVKIGYDGHETDNFLQPELRPIIRDLHRATELNPRDVKYLALRSEVYASNVLLGLAAKDICKIIEIEPNNPASYLKRASFLRQNAYFLTTSLDVQAACCNVMTELAAELAKISPDKTPNQHCDLRRAIIEKYAVKDEEKAASLTPQRQ